MKNRELGTLAFRLLAIYQCILAVNHFAFWLPQWPMMRSSIGMSSQGDRVWLFYLLGFPVTEVVMLTLALVLWKYAPALSRACIDQSEVSPSESTATSAADWPAMVICLLGVWILLENVPELAQMILHSLTPRPPEGSMPLTLDKTFDAATWATLLLKLAMGTVLSLRGKRVARVLETANNWSTVDPEARVG